ncbi:hypothetical protein F5Y11DRAFT_197629 [Daldinia sp. FL1419]|nr:hypothetical protein F5Y11DRAFT_197629 [Daldinia sp. FL1419]
MRYTHTYSSRRIQPSARGYGSLRQLTIPVALDAGCWKALLEGLATLECVMKAPIWGYHGGWSVWVAQLETVLGFVGENVDESTDVVVDDNYSMFLCEAVDRCFRKGFRRVKTEEGDAYYY